MDSACEILAVIPARGGSKSIESKNIALLNNHPLLSYVAEAGKKSQFVNRLLCSTDCPKIAEVCRNLAIEVMPRDSKFAQDDSNIVDTLFNLLDELANIEQYQPDVVVLLQPTSPFLLTEQIDECIALLLNSKDAASSQTISEFPPNHHAHCQRYIDDGQVKFKFYDIRSKQYNKQRREALFVFGNLVVFKTEAFRRQREVFAQPSIPLQIPRCYAHDVDNLEDLKIAEMMIKSGMV